MSSFKGKDIISINDLTKDEIEHILDTANKLSKNKKPLLVGKVMTTLFFEPSTRTRLSFESAMTRLGGQVITVADPSSSSHTKGESLWDTIKVVTGYVDVIVIRHPLEGSARAAAEAASVPVVNGGDGSNQHPTQTLLDLYTIKQAQGKINNLKVALAGDLKYGRTVHSLALALAHFNCELYFASPDTLKMPDYIKDELDSLKIKYHEYDDVKDVISKVDILYATRIQKERFPDVSDYEKVKNAYVIDTSMLQHVRQNLKILHPLPRVAEISKNVDATGHAYYFEQAHNGVLIRQALLCLILGVLE